MRKRRGTGEPGLRRLHRGRLIGIGTIEKRGTLNGDAPAFVVGEWSRAPCSPDGLFMAPDDSAARAEARNDVRSDEPRPERTPGQRGGNGPHRAAGNGNGGRRHSRNGGKRGSMLRRPVVLIAGAALLLLLIVAVTIWWLHARHYETTDDAFIDTHLVHVSPQVAGRVVRVHVDDNQRVNAGDPIVDIDPALLQAHLDQVTAQATQTQTQLSLAHAQVEVAQASLEQAEATEAGAAAQAENAARDLARYRALKATLPSAVAQQQLDQAVATADNTAAQHDAAARQVQGAAAQVTAANAQVAAAEAQVKAAEAQVEDAQINLGYTHVTAAMPGTVAQRTVAVGNYVSPGQEMLALVPLQVWVTANFKETELAHMRIGQPADVSVDACPGAKIRGHVDSVQRGAGQAFGVLPPENATGNWVKVVQRVPVKIVFDDLQVDGCTLGPGMSVEATVKVR
jgi:membrane fusion protein (multidrug efflux system)